MLKYLIPCGDRKIEAHCTKITAPKKAAEAVWERRGCRSGYRGGYLGWQLG
ncbi:MAG: hypothetical protein J6C39_04520 [Clostridia bacterium]|nr:hypothetical protein [Clostridia bacterium]MBO5206656.1 hypothetical protein [Clostridia bacterium]MBP3583212.1 hypothetical protein [Clostridia bacterium]